MARNEPDHGAKCLAFAYPLACRFCAADLLFVACDHGLRLLLDSHKQPWAAHDCHRYWLALYGDASYERALAMGMRNNSPPDSWSVDSCFADLLENGRLPAEAVEAAPPGPVAALEVGIVAEIAPRVNLYRELRIAEGSPLTAALLGPIAAEQVGRVVLRAGSIGDQVAWVFRALTPARLLEAADIQPGDLVACRLRGLNLPGREAVWMCEKVGFPFGH
jgi:hypothetical protein